LPYSTAIPALEAYVASGGVVWVQGAISDGCYPLPFGGQSCIDFGVEDPIVDTCSPMMIGVSNPIVGEAASHVTDPDLLPQAHVVVINDNNGNPVNATTYATLFLNGTNYNVCGGNGGSSFSMAVFSGTWQIGISGDMTSRGYDNPPNQNVTVTGTNSPANIVLYPLGRTPPRLTGGTYGNGQFQLTLTGNPDAMYRIEMTTNLSNPASWVALRTNTAFGGTFTFLDTNAPRVPPRFYRAVLAQ